MSKPCACGCGERARPGRQFQIGHSFETAKLWRGKGKPDIRKGTKHSVTVMYKDGQRVEAPTPFENKEPAWVPSPSEFYVARFEKRILGGTLFKLTDGSLVYAHHSILPYGFSDSMASVRIERSDRGVKFKALEVIPYSTGEESQ